MQTERFSPQEEARIEHRVDADNMSYADAVALELQARRDAESAARFRQSLSSGALQETVTPPSEKTQPKTRRHYSRRGGRAYPEPSDSSLDPYWNV